MTLPVKEVVLTIDDSPTKDFRSKCEYLEAHHIPAIFFCIGRQLEAMPDLIIEAIKKGFIIGNHSYSHPHFSDLSLPKAFNEIEKTHLLINEIYRAANTPRPANWFRFPFGDKGDGCFGRVFANQKRSHQSRKQAIQTCLQQLGYTQPDFQGITYSFYRQAGLLADIDWHWTFDVMEWNLNMHRPDFGLDTPEKILQRLESTCPEDSRGLSSRDKRWVGDPHSDEIILLHDHIETTKLFFEIINKLVSLPLRFKLPAS